MVREEDAPGRSRVHTPGRDLGSERGTEDLAALLLGALRMPTLTFRNRSSLAFFRASFCVMV